MSASHQEAQTGPAGDRWAVGRGVLRAADPRMAALIEAEPQLDPDGLLDGLPSDLWGALVLQVIGQQISVAAAAAILGRLEALQDGRLMTPVELLAMDGESLRGVGLSRTKTIYLHDLAERLVDGRLDGELLETLDDDDARTELTRVKGVGRFTADGVLMLAMRRPDVWPAADLALRRAVERVWGLEVPASIAEVDALGDRFRPWRTLAAAYLYRTGPGGRTRKKGASKRSAGSTPSGTTYCDGPEVAGASSSAQSWFVDVARSVWRDASEARRPTGHAPFRAQRMPVSPDIVTRCGCERDAPFVTTRCASAIDGYTAAARSACSV